MRIFKIQPTDDPNTVKFVPKAKAVKKSAPSAAPKHARDTFEVTYQLLENGKKLGKPRVTTVTEVATIGFKGAAVQVRVAARKLGMEATVLSATLVTE